ncbi:conjugative transfer system coupling protein TraD [Marinobacterium aestuariivivens]|uniref:Conjugative transfer system coupling protein TraD n=1 Tax=Marinobacterium aestuariivivens TaxID=1698799 RepID=A0ABW2A997_9GAMM
MKYDPLDYEMPWRPNYEMQAVMGWVAASTAALAVNQYSTMPPEPFYWMTGICGVMVMAQLPKAIRLHNLKKHLRGRELEFISLKELQKIMKGHPEEMWIGTGFDWESRHTQRVFEIMKRDWSSIVSLETNGDKLARMVEKRAGKKIARKLGIKEKRDPMGAPWIHGVEPKEKILMQPMKHTEGHTLIAGTTGAGKTRMFDILISQAILRGESVIIIDPKGDKEMRDNARRACEAIGEPERFVSFHPAFPEESVRIDPLRNFTRVTEIASRLAALIPSEAGADPFKSFAWQALNNIAQGLVMTYQRPNLTLLRRFLEGGAAGLVIKAVEAYAEQVKPDWEAEFEPYREKAKNGHKEKIAFAMLRFYYDFIQPEHPSSELEGLLSMYQHDATHFSKMVANLLPIMNMLTSGELGKMLSPDPSDLNDTRGITDTAKIINNGQVAYIGLDSLTDSMVGSAIGSVLLSDLTAVAGDRYNFGVNNRVVNIFVDEAAEVINDPFIQLLNKGRGAKLRLFVATQTFADFAARLGSKDKASQVLGNINNTFALRIEDKETQEYITDKLPKTRVKYVMRTQGQNTHGDEPIMHGGNQGERLMEEEADMFSPQLLGMLPNLEFIAKISGGKLVKGRLPILS